MAELTPWQRARQDTQLLRLWREIFAAVLGAGIALGALAIFGSPDSAFATEAIVAGAAVLAAALTPLLELGWNYARAPGRLASIHRFHLAG